MTTKAYNAIIVGASFADLAVARHRHGRILLLDRRGVGEVQTSAGGTPLWVPQALGAGRLQDHRGQGPGRAPRAGASQSHG